MSTTTEQTDVEPRDYLAEAQQIAKGESRLLAQGEHLKAMTQFAASLQGNVEAMGRILAAIVLDQVQPGQPTVIFIPKGVLEDVTQHKCGVLLEATAHGTIVHLVMPTPKKELN